MEEQSDGEKSLLSPTLPRWWRVLPFLILLVFIEVIEGLLLNDFIEQRYANFYQLNSSTTENSRQLCLNASRTTHHSTTRISTTTSKYPISTTISPTDHIQASTARLNIIMAISSTIPSMLTCILLGTNCDRIGRKPLIVLPFVGKIIYFGILTAVAYYTLSDLWIILAVIFNGVFGASGLCVLSVYSYVSDCTNEKTRTRAIMITIVSKECLQFLPLITTGLYLQHPHLIELMAFTFSLSLVSFVFCMILQPESNLNVQHLNIFQKLKLIRLKPVTQMFRVFLVKREGHKQRSLLVIVITHASHAIMLIGFNTVWYLYLYGPPFCFDSFGVSLTGITRGASMVVLTIIFTLAVGKRSDHLALPALGVLAFMTHSILTGLASQIWMIHLAVGIGALKAVLVSILRSRMTKLVEPNEYAAVFIPTFIVETGLSYGIQALSNEIYRVSFTFYTGLDFFVFSMFGALAILLMLILHILEHRSSVAKKTLILTE